MEYQRFTINGMDFEVPATDGKASEADIRHAARLSDNDVIIGIDKDTSTNTPIGRGETVDLNRSSEMVSTGPWRAAGRDIALLNNEARKLQDELGDRNVVWSESFEYFCIADWPLPASQYNAVACNVIIIVPDNYGYGEPWKHAFLPSNIRYWHNEEWYRIEHYFDGVNGFRAYVPETVTRFREAGWAYLCLHMDEWRKGDDALKYLHLLRNFLSDPLQPCKGNEGAKLVKAALER